MSSSRMQNRKRTLVSEGEVMTGREIVNIEIMIKRTTFEV